jgi:para-aminobenzoate synthetase component 1
MALNILEIPFSEPEIRRIQTWLSQQEHSLMLDGNGYTYPHHPFRQLMAAGKNLVSAGTDWKSVLLKKEPSAWWFGYLGYELKGRDPGENRETFADFPAWRFFEADAVFEIRDGKIFLHSAQPEAVWQEISVLPEYVAASIPAIPDFQAASSKEEYLKGVEKVQDLIREGDVYELNLCQYFRSPLAPDGLDFYLSLNHQFPMPFSAWFKSGEIEIASASPERFLKKSGNELISQPIKGTAKRGNTEEEDQANRLALFHSEKERAENMMIVDLVRNDLAKVSRIGSTTVEEMFGIYAFPKVFQMISTIRSVQEKEKTVADVLDSAFPMGSMTGAPKEEVMKQIRNLEPFCRGAYSGALGYFGPEGDFDFNVLIRSLFINHAKNECGFAVGSAITIDSEAEAEWAECQAKAAALLQVCGNPGIDFSG